MRSHNYIFSANHSTNDGAERIDLAREMVRILNKEARTQGRPERYRIVLSFRKGRNNRHAWKYENKDMRGKRWRMEDMSHVDVYALRVDRETAH